ncbi:hypothetical protein BX600DRAFT_289028 [Xylariales sp. PMI_506]|nr:hypothetical protein BX600DRAFT_289028 [Xylariales sp. PMI_506]
MNNLKLQVGRFPGHVQTPGGRAVPPSGRTAMLRPRGIESIDERLDQVVRPEHIALLQIHWLGIDKMQTTCLSPILLAINYQWGHREHCEYTLSINLGIINWPRLPTDTVNCRPPTLFRHLSNERRRCWAWESNPSRAGCNTVNLPVRYPRAVAASPQHDGTALAVSGFCRIQTWVHLTPLYLRVMS